MLVRSKLVATLNADGVHLHGVYEGSNELQAISENAIFGEATPAAWGTLGPEAAGVLGRDEYYLDMFRDGEGAGGYLLTRVLTRTYRSDIGQGRVQYRFAAMEGDPVHLEYVIANPKANAALADHELVFMGMKLARGRRSDEEIALRQKMLDDWVTGGFYKNSHPAQYEGHRLYLERALRKAEGAE